MPEPANIVVFLSTVSDEFGDYREKLRKTLTSLRVEVKIQEDFKALGGVTLENLVEYIQACDLVVHLVGDMTGAVPEAPQVHQIRDKYPDLATRFLPLADAMSAGVPVSYTQWEAWLALYHEKPLLIALADTDAERGPRYERVKTPVAIQRAHVARLETVGHYPSGTFTNPDNLASRIIYPKIVDLAQSQPTADRVSGADIATFLSSLFIGALGAYVGYSVGLTVALAPVFTSLLSVIVAICFAVVVFYYGRTIGVLGAGAQRMGSPERYAYDRLRASLIEGNLPERLYAKWLEKFLDWVERFFGDKGMANRTLLPRAFGLKTPAPLWTAPAFDRCLLLALIYPTVMILLIWAISGEVGPAEKAMGLKPKVDGWQRGLGVAAVSFEACVLWSYSPVKRWGRLLDIILLGAVFVASGFAFAYFFVDLFFVVFAVAITVAAAAAIAGVFAFIFAVAISVAICTAVTVAVTAAGESPLSLTLPSLGAGKFDLIGGFAAACVGIWVFWKVIAFEWSRKGFFLSLYVVVMTVGCFAVTGLVSSQIVWAGFVGPLLLFFGLLTFLHAPFDWASLGLTRALLRRGLELKGWWPYALALADAALAAVIIALLALTIVVGVQAFDELAVYGGGPSAAVLPLESLFDGIEKDPAAPEYWWLYALLLSTMIPSLVNLVIGGMALTRGMPGLGRLLLNFMPVGKAVPAFDRAWMAAVLSVQVFGGIFLGIAAQAFLAWALLFHIMPLVGPNLLDMARAVAAADVPGHIGRLFIGSP